MHWALVRSCAPKGLQQRLLEQNLIHKLPTLLRSFKFAEVCLALQMLFRYFLDLSGQLCGPGLDLTASMM